MFWKIDGQLNMQKQFEAQRKHLEGSQQETGEDR